MNNVILIDNDNGHPTSRAGPGRAELPRQTNISFRRHVTDLSYTFNTTKYI